MSKRPQAIKNGALPRGFSLVEALTVLVISGVIAALTIQMLVKNKEEPWTRITEDYLTHLGSVYSQTELKTGNVPDLAANGIPGTLSTWESVATYAAGPPHTLTYPKGILVYLYPEEVAGITNPVLTGTNNREWVLIDLNGATGPNSLASTGDRVLIYIENTSGRVMTSCQKKAELGQSGTQSFYDVKKGYTCP